MKWFHVLLIFLVIASIIYLQEPSEKVDRVVPLSNKSGVVVPELVGVDYFVNSDEFNFSDLVGSKVFLVDFWTYSCINCQRTIPYLNAWFDKYKDSGFVVVGVHSPEFEFEKKFENVVRAVDKFDIAYPVVLDNEHDTWRAFRNRYWPAKYLVDIDGYVVWSHFGEGAYDEAEREIQKVLMERSARLGLDGVPLDMSVVSAPSVDFRRIGTPEIYFGYEFARGNFGNPEGLIPDAFVNYSLPESFVENDAYLEGGWFVDKDFSRLVSGSGKVVLRYDAKNVNIVASGPANLSVFVDDVFVENIVVSDEDLYTIVEGVDYGKHKLSFDVVGDLRLFTFTFG